MAYQITWAIPIGVLLFLEATFLILYLYEKYKKVSYILYTLGLNLYIFSIFYTWNIFEDNKNFVLIMLLVSSFVLFVLGKLVFKSREVRKNKFLKKDEKFLNYLILIFSFFLLLTFLIGIFSTSSYDLSFKDSINLVKFNKSKYSYSDNNIVIGTIKINSSYILPKSVIIKPFFACYNNRRIPIIIDKRYLSLDRDFIINLLPGADMTYNILIPKYIFNINDEDYSLKKYNVSVENNNTFVFVYKIKNNLGNDYIFNCNLENKILIKKIKVD